MTSAPEPLWKFQDVPDRPLNIIDEALLFPDGPMCA